MKWCENKISLMLKLNTYHIKLIAFILKYFLYQYKNMNITKTHFKVQYASGTIFFLFHFEFFPLFEIAS